MNFYTIDVWRDESIWTWKGEAATDAEAEELARQQLNEDWEEEHETWADLAAHMDGTYISFEPVADARARAEAPAMLAALRWAEKELAGFQHRTGTPDAKLGEIRAILARIDGEAAL